MYLLPGLTAGERRAVFRRLRQEASRGFGVPLPGPELALARGLDQVRTAARTAASVVRLHPAITLLPGACVVAATALFVVAAADGQPLPGGPRPGLTAAPALAAARPAFSRSASAASISGLPVFTGPPAPWTAAGRSRSRGVVPAVPAQSALMTDVAGLTAFSAGAVGNTQVP